MQNKQDIVKWSVTFLLYTFSFGLALQHGLWWDDWTIFHTSIEGIRSEFMGAGYVTCYLFLKSIWPITVSKVILMKLIIFVGYFITAIMINYILSNIPRFRQYAFLVALFTLLLPFNHARVAFAVINYVYNYTIFWIAFGLLVYYHKNGNYVFRLGSLVLFFLSFNMNSMFFLFSIVILYILNYESTLLEGSKLKTLFFKYVDYIAMCILFLVIKYIFFPAQGIYAGVAYNEVKLNALLISPFLSFYYIYLALGGLAMECFKAVLYGWWIIIPLAAIFNLFLRSIEIKQNNSYAIHYLLTGIFLLWIACLPYAIVGREPTFNAWNSRSQLLLPLGTALLIIFVGHTLLNRKIKGMIVVYSILLATFSTYNFKSMIDYRIDWIKQLSIKQQLKNNNDVKEASLILIADSTLYLNAKERTPLFYEYSGMLSEVYGDHTRFATVNLSDTSIIKEAIKYPEYKISDYRPTEKKVLLTITSGEPSITGVQAFSLVFYELIDRNRFNDQIGKLVQLQSSPLD